MATTTRLSKKSILILELIADGHSYSQIVDGGHDVKYIDIFAAAREALELLDSGDEYAIRMAAIKERHPRAYEPWSPEEDASLERLYRSGVPTTEIASRLQRRPTAIGSRLRKLALEIPGWAASVG